MIGTRAETQWVQVTDRLREFVRRRVPEADVDDVVQDTLLRVHRGLAGLQDEERFGPWVYRIAHSAVADHLRGRARPVERGRAAIDEDLEAPPPENADGFRDELVRCLATFVAEIPSPYREAIILTELQGMGQREAAEMLGLSVSGMKSRVQRGREQLRRMFECCCDYTRDGRGKVIDCEPRDGCGPSATDPGSC
jgi:RNA polymerase sigma-70 factor (ECF subfamily)